MAKKKKPLAFDVEVSHDRQEEAFVERQSPEAEAGPANSSSRLSLPLNNEGTIDWDRARDSQKEKFTQAVLNSPETLEMIGLAAGATGEQQGWSEESIRFGLDLISMVNSFVFRMASKKVMGTQVDADVASQCFAFSDEKDHNGKSDYDKLVPPTQRLADRAIHVDPKYQDLILLGTALAAIVGKQAQTALEMQSERDEKKKPQTQQVKVERKPIVVSGATA